MKREGEIRNCKKSEDGSVLVTTLLILLVVNLLVIGLMQTSVRESRLATFKTLDSEVFHITDSCVQDTMKWFGDLSAPTSDLPHEIAANDLTHMFIGDETDDEILRLSNFSYGCNTDIITVQSVAGDSTGEGDEIGEGAGYGETGDLSPRYFYSVESSGFGPQNSNSSIVATISVEY